VWYVRLAGRALRVLLLTVLRLTTRTSFKGLKNIPKHGPVILAVRHASLLDPPIVFCGIKRDAVFMTMAEMWKSRWFGRMLDWFDYIPVERHTAHAVDSLAPAVRDLKGGTCLVIFPEDHLTPDGEVQMFHRGVGYLAIATGAPVVPVYLDGTDRALGIGKKFRPFRRPRVVVGQKFRPFRRIRMIVGPELRSELVDPTGGTKAQQIAFANQLRDRVIALKPAAVAR
jgi:1-acyl-sn-glycerol-3-phosphate acyltransferase